MDIDEENTGPQEPTGTADGAAPAIDRPTGPATGHTTDRATGHVTGRPTDVPTGQATDRGQATGRPTDGATDRAIAGSAAADPAGAAAAGEPAASAGRSTGDERVDEALARLHELARTAVAGHVEIFDDVRHRLQDVLTSIDQDGPRPAVPPRP